MVDPCSLVGSARRYARRLQSNSECVPFLEMGASRVHDTFQDLHGMPQLPGIAVQR